MSAIGITRIEAKSLKPQEETTANNKWCDYKLIAIGVALVLMCGIWGLFYGLTTIPEEKKEEKKSVIIATYAFAALTIFLCLCFLLIIILYCNPNYNSILNRLEIGIFVSNILTLILYFVSILS